MNWKELAEHCKLHKEGKLIQKKDYTPQRKNPLWLRIKEYENCPTLEQQGSLEGKNINELITQLKVGEKIRLVN